jgi:glycosyltransferase involved in cell wall biosynthesis
MPDSYVVVTPVRDEEQYLPKTIECVVSQTVRPAEWILVDDGSTDRTGQIIDASAREHTWIIPLHLQNRGFRQSGGGVARAFSRGYDALRTKDWDFIVKLDGDLSFAPDYFERCFQHFHKSPRLGIAGGTIHHVIHGDLVVERTPRFHVRGATKVYRRACWDDIGGLIQAPGWDTVDEVKANMHGWETRSLADLEVRHHRYTGKADGVWGGYAKNGLGSYISGYHPVYMFVKCLTHLWRKPYVIGSVALFHGFMSGYVKRVPQLDDRELIRYLRKQQLRRLLLRPTVWR